MSEQSRMVTAFLNHVRDTDEAAKLWLAKMNSVGGTSPYECCEFLRQCERLSRRLSQLEYDSTRIRKSEISPIRMAAVRMAISSLRATMAMVITESIRAHAVVAGETLSGQRLAQAFGLEEAK